MIMKNRMPPFRIGFGSTVLAALTSVLNWNAGNLFGHGEIDGTLYTVRILGVQFDVAGIVELEGMLLSDNRDDGTDDSVADAVAAAAPPIGAGRPRSEKWSDWIAELVAYVHDEGIPDGVGTEGQEPVIAAVDSRLIEQREGRAEPDYRAASREGRSSAPSFSRKLGFRRFPALPG